MELCHPPPPQASSQAEVLEVSRRAMLASVAVHILLTQVSIWPVLSFRHHPFTPRSLAQVCALRESSAEHPDPECTCLCVPCSSLLYAICPALSPVPGPEQGWGPRVLREGRGAHFSSSAHLAGLPTALSFLWDYVCSPKSRAQAPPHLFQSLHCVQKNRGGDVRWHPKK